MVHVSLPLGGPWDDSMAYNHAEWVYDTRFTATPEATEKLKWFGVVVAFLSTFNNQATIVFALLTGQHIFTSIVLFINHHYLFFLLSTLMAIYCNCGTNAGWIHAVRGQIVVVYAFASLWKYDRDWIDGTIVKGIFLSFEEQGDNRGVPWKKLYTLYPNVFVFLGCSGLLLDTVLFLVLMFLKPGHKLQSICIVFHGFTGYTMSKRIGYSFPLAMILASLVFQPSPLIAQEQNSFEGDTLSHFNWIRWQVTGSVNFIADIRMYFGNKDDNQVEKEDNEKEKENTNKQSCRTIYYMPLLYLLIQWLVPLRMPLVSNKEYKHTFEGYRWSWTMMLHSKSNMLSPGLSYMTLRPECNGMQYPNPQADQSPFWDVHSFPYEQYTQQSIRSRSTMQMFPRTLPKVFNEVDKKINNHCPGEKMVMKAAYFSSTNAGPFHRIIDPTVDLMETHRAHVASTWYQKILYAILDKAPSGYEFILRGSGSVTIPSGHNSIKSVDGQITFVDRSSCLQIDPIRVHSRSFKLSWDTDSVVPFRLKLRGCPDIRDLSPEKCAEIYLEVGEVQEIPAMRTILIGIDARRNLGDTPVCSKTTKEDVVITLTDLGFPQEIEQQLKQQQRMQQHQSDNNAVNGRDNNDREL